MGGVAGQRDPGAGRVVDRVPVVDVDCHDQRDRGDRQDESDHARGGHPPRRVPTGAGRRRRDRHAGRHGWTAPRTAAGPAAHCRRAAPYARSQASATASQS